MKNADMPAMPVITEKRVANTSVSTCEQSGLTKREDIAKYLMASLINNDGAISEIGNEQWYAERACILTDALLKELEK